MSKLCDLYVSDLQDNSGLKLLKIYDKNFIYNEFNIYEGFLGINVNRIKLINFLIDLRNKGIKCFNAPIAYRDNITLSKEAAYTIAKKYAKAQGYKVHLASYFYPPVFWLFNIADDPQERAGGVVLVDKLDGHIWSNEEYEEYMYDYNNIL